MRRRHARCLQGFLLLMDASVDAHMAAPHGPAERSGRRPRRRAPDGIYVDGTFGRGGHCRLILAQLAPQGRLIAFDKDPQAIAAAATRSPTRASRSCTTASPPCASAGRARRRAGRPASCWTWASPRRRSTTRRAASLFAPTARWTCAWITTRGTARRSGWPPRRRAQMAEVIREYGEERFAFQIAKAIVARRADRGPISTTRQLAESWLARSRPARRARTRPRAPFRLFGFSSMRSLKNSKQA